MLQPNNLYQSFFPDIGGQLQLPKRPVLALPNPITLMQTRLRQLRHEATVEYKKLKLLESFLVAQEAKLMDIKFNYHRLDKQLAKRDGRTIVCRPQLSVETKVLKNTLKVTKNKELQQALSLMSVKDKEELIKNLLN